MRMGKTCQPCHGQNQRVSPISQTTKASSSMPAFLHSSARRRGGSTTSSVVKTQVLENMSEKRTWMRPRCVPPMHSNSLLRLDILEQSNTILGGTVYRRHEIARKICP